MAKKITSYEQDIRDTLSEKSHIKDAIKIAEKVKSTQKKAYPNGIFKTSLKERLWNIHTLDTAAQRVPKLHILRNFMMFCSFFFITGVVFVILGSRDDFKEEVHQEEFSPWFLDSGIDPNSGFFKAFTNLDEESQVEIEEQENIEDSSAPIEAIENPWILNDLQPKAQAIQDFDESLDTWEKNQDLGNINEPSFSENAAMSSSMMMDDSAADTMDNENISSDDIFIESESFRSEEWTNYDQGYENSEAIYWYYQEQLYELCEYYEWVVQDDEYTCLFPSWVTCNTDNIGPNTSEPCIYLYGSGSTK